VRVIFFSLLIAMSHFNFKIFYLGAEAGKDACIGDGKIT
jgi:hypothetical protein